MAGNPYTRCEFPPARLLPGGPLLTYNKRTDRLAIEDAVYDSPGSLFQARIIILSTLLGL